MLLQAGQLLSTLGSGMSAVAYPLLALAVTHSPAKAGYVGAVVIAPLLLLALPAGVAADRFDRKRLMIVSDAAAAAALGTLAGAVLAHAVTLWLILAVAFLDSTCGVLFRAGFTGAFRAVVPLSQVAAAASISQGRAATVRLAAPPVGGALFGIARSLPFLGDAVSYAFSTGSLLLMRPRFQESLERDPAPLRRRLTEGISFFVRIPFLRTAMLMISISNFTFAGMQLALIVLARRHGLPAAAIGGLVALTGATTLLGSIVSPVLRRTLPMHLILLSEFWAALAYVVFIGRPNVYALAGAMAAQAFCFPNTDAAAAAYSYALIPDRLLGRAMAVSNTLRVLAAPLGPLVAGLMLGTVSPRITIGALTGATLATALVGTFSTSIRRAPPLSELTR